MIAREVRRCDGTRSGRGPGERIWEEDLARRWRGAPASDLAVGGDGATEAGPRAGEPPGEPCLPDSSTTEGRAGRGHARIAHAWHRRPPVVCSSLRSRWRGCVATQPMNTAIRASSRQARPVTHALSCGPGWPVPTASPGEPERTRVLGCTCYGMRMLSERTQVLLTPEQRACVERQAMERGTSVGAVIREAVDARFAPRDRSRRAAFEALRSMDLPVDDWTTMKSEILRGATE